VGWLGDVYGPGGYWKLRTRQIALRRNAAERVGTKAALTQDKRATPNQDRPSGLSPVKDAERSTKRSTITAE
jgi:hypothetical protein